MVPVIHIWATYETEPVWSQLLSLCGWERKELGTAVSEAGEEGVKKREAGHTSFLALDFPFVDFPFVEVPGVCGVRCGWGRLCVGSYF